MSARNEENLSNNVEICEEQALNEVISHRSSTASTMIYTHHYAM